MSAGDDLLAIARRVLDLGAKLPGELEVYAQQSRTTQVKVYARAVESLVVGEPRGLGVRYVVGERSGYAYTADLTAPSLERVMREVVANAAATDPDPYVGLPTLAEAYPDAGGLWRPGVGTVPTQEKIGLALEAEAAALGAPEIETVETSVYADGEERTALVSSTGIEITGEQTYAYVYLSAHARRGDDVQTALGYSVGREPQALDAEAAGLEAAEQARLLLGASPCESARMTVVFDREVAAAVISVIAQAMTAEAVQKGRSLFAGRLDQTVASARLTLVDDGLDPEGLASSPFDGEGVPHRRTPLVEKGVLKGFLHSTYTARREGDGAVSTGSATRQGYRGQPGVGPSNLIVTAGEGGRDELLQRVGQGFYVVSVTGLHSGANPVSGEFSVGAVGHLIEGGALGRPVREVTIASDLLSLLASVVDLGSDTRWVPFYGSVSTPSLAVAGVTVSGR